MNRFENIIQQIGQQAVPPVHLWEPENVGEIDIRIDAQGHWLHEGDPILRKALVKLFASILWCEEEQYFLVTPVEKLSIVVEDVPFLVHQMEYLEDSWIAITNTQEQLIVSEEHPVELRSYQNQLLPYIRVRYDLWARLNRRSYLQWVNAALELQQAQNQLLLLKSQNYEFEVARI